MGTGPGPFAARRRRGAGAARTAGWLLPALAYVLILGLLGVTTKLALEDLSWQQLILWTAIVYLALSAGLVLAGGERLGAGRGAGWAAVSGASAVAALILLFLALGAGDVSRVVPITSAYPVITALLAAAVLAERVTPRRAAATLLVVAGVIVLSLE